MFEKVKHTLNLKQSMRKKDQILPIVDKLENKQELTGQEKAQIIDAIRHKMHVDEIRNLDVQKKRFMWHSVASTATSLTSCFIFSVLSKKYIKMNTYLKFPVNLAIFAGSLSFTMGPAFDELGNRYGEVMDRHKEFLNRETICAYFEIDKEIDYTQAYAKQFEEVKNFQQERLNK